MNHLEVTTTLAACGYRQITLRNFNELIAGVRYVLLETLGADRFRAVQFLPDERIAWTVTRWEDESAVLICSNQSRSEIYRQFEFKLSYDIYARYSRHYMLASDYMIGDGRYRVARTPFFATFESFISNVSGAHVRPEQASTEHSFEVAHPARHEVRMQVDIERQIRELEAREAAVRQQEAFSQVHEIRSMAAQADNNGDRRYALDLYSVSDEVRRRVQSSLDARLPVQRADVNLLLMEMRSRPSYREPIYTTGTYAPVTNAYSATMPHSPPISQRTASTKLTQAVEVVKTEPRRIILED